MTTKTSDTPYDLAIIGTGASGYAASIYASRYNLTNILIGTVAGGQTAEAHLIQNYPGIIEIEGHTLMNNMKEHAESYNIPIYFDTVTKIDGSHGSFTIETTSGKKYRSKTILLTIGMKRRKLGIDGEERFLGKGITYCATCDGPLFKGKTVAVVGGSDSANTASLYLSTIASKVYQIYRKQTLRGEPAWADRVRGNPAIEVIYQTNVTSTQGTDILENITLDPPYQGKKTLAVDGLFIEIGAEPDTRLSKQLDLEHDENNYIQVNAEQKTSVPGIWAAGDITTNSNYFHQVVTAVAEGAVAAQDIYRVLSLGCDGAVS